MSLLTPNMNLTAWTDGTDSYSHTDLANDWSIIDGHDHTPGKGVQIPSAGIANNAITTTKIIDDAVTNAKIADAAIDFAQLTSKVLTMVPLGAVIPWWRPNISTSLPTGGLFVICAGQTLTAGQHDFPGGGSIVMPDMVNHFGMGAAADGSTIGTTGGANAYNLQHSHSGGSHSHNIAPHSHTVNAHSHTVSAHSHGVSSDGGHTHTYESGQTMHTRQNAFQTLQFIIKDVDNIDRNHDLQSLYITSYTPPGGDGLVHMDTGGVHSHGGGTGTATPGTDSQSPGTSNLSLTTDAASAATGTALGTSVDLRPSWVGLLYICRVKLTY
jgi:hypothetical protein